MKMDASAFQDTSLEWGGRANRPLRAGRITRTVYCLALLGFVRCALGQEAPWVEVATRSGLGVGLGTWVFFLISAAMAARIYGVVSYADALDARPPYPLGWLLRWLGWVVMLAGMAGLAAMVLKSLDLLLFKGAGGTGTGFPAIGLWATLLASIGWVGCLLFEMSRWVGYAVARSGAARSRHRHLPGASVF